MGASTGQNFLISILVLALSAFILSACSTGSGKRPVNSAVNPADIKPVYTVRNSPTPIPSPRMKPRIPKTKKFTAKPTSKPKPKATSRSVYLARSSGQTVTVKKGDTLYALSRRYKVSVVDLTRVNKIRPPYRLSVGQKVKIPTRPVHSVKRGETSYSIAQRYGVRLSDLIRVNGIRRPYTLSVGQKLIIPGGAKKQGAVKPTAKKARTRTVTPKRWIPPAKTGQYFAWPLRGKLISSFGPKEGGIHNDGINLSAPRGTAIRAAEAGIVAYASNDLPGYGNLILVKHSGGWVTAYAHTESVRVKEGQVVNKGEVIARVGSTGGVRTPQLHFEIRRGRKALNPINYLQR